MSDLRFFWVLKLRIITQHHQKVIRVKMKQMYEQSYNKVYWHCYREGKKLKNTLHTYIIIHFPKLMAGMEIPFKPPFARPSARRPPPTAAAPTTAFVAIRFPRSAVLLRPEE